MNSSVLACNYAISGAELNSKVTASLPVATPVGSVQKLPVIRCQQQSVSNSNDFGKKAAILGFAALLTVGISTSSAHAGVIDDYLEKSKANKVILHQEEEM